MKEDFQKEEEKLEENLKLIDQIIYIGSDVGNLVVDMLESLKSQYELMPAFIDYKNKLDVVISSIKNIKDHESLKEKYKVIYNQALVLLVENFESFLNDLSKIIIDKYPHMIKWPESKKKLPVDVNLLRYSVPTIGDLVLTSLEGEVNFQDLQSTLRFIKEYLDKTISLDENDKNNIILGQALRNIIIHNNSRVDHKFLNQIRNINNLSYKDKDEIKITFEEFTRLKSSFKSFAKNIINEILN